MEVPVHVQGSSVGAVGYGGKNIAVVANTICVFVGATVCVALRHDVAEDLVAEPSRVAEGDQLVGCCGEGDEDDKEKQAEYCWRRGVTSLNSGNEGSMVE